MQNIFLDKARALEPALFRRKVAVCRYGDTVKEPGSWFGYRFAEGEKPELLRAGDRFCADFGEHCTGNLTFLLTAPVTYPDAPMRLHVKFAESLQELGDSYDACKSRMSRTWLQEETVTLDEPGEVVIPRRFAFRYIEVTVVCTNAPIALSDLAVTAYTSADHAVLKAGPLDKRLAQLDAIGVRTLSECMQRVFEDGPKRDRRLWIGDLRLQALVNYETFDNVDLVKRCLYMFAGYTEEGKHTPRCIYINSKGTACDGAVFVDYSLMFNLILCDYYEHTGDEVFVDELFHIAEEQMHLACEAMGEDGIVQEIPIEERWAFIDWCRGLKKITSMQGVILYTLNKMTELCEKTGRTSEALEYRRIAEWMKQACRERLYDAEKGAFVNAYDDYQYSVHSQVWMILAGVLDKEEGQKLLRKILSDADVVKPVTPYMHHYVVEALLYADMQEEALAYVENYWGQMADLGADTYWEVFVPGDPEVSPYNDRIMNSACHAWSCSPSYFIRKYWK